MNKRINFLLPVVMFAIVIGFFITSERSSTTDVSEIRKKHSEFLKQKAPSTDAGYSRLEKIKRGLAPNKYYEEMAYLTMNPALGYPEPHKVQKLARELQQARMSKSLNKTQSDNARQPWVSRGPNNVGGRTRVLLFDPNDASGRRVFAGAISGGLWVNDNITNVNSPWKQVEGLPANLNISCLTVDPNDSNIWYAGTGEQYTGGDVVGTGVYKTVNGGVTWTKVLDVEKFATPGSGDNLRVVGGLYYINDIIAWDNGSQTEIFIGVSTHLYGRAQNPYNLLGYFDRGLYSSTDGGNSWSKVIADESFNDFEVDAVGNIWVATTYSPGLGDRGGKIFKREKGENTSWSQIATVPNVYRTEIEASASDPAKFYVLAEDSEDEASLWITRDGFQSISPLNEPDDVDLLILSDDFAGEQAFYNLMIESDPTNDDIVYVGGIDLFRSVNGGQSWQQISKWSNYNNLKQLPVSLVHADQHVMQFRPGNTNQAVFGHDGGVSFASDLAAAPAADVFITPETEYITTQFYSVAVAPVAFGNGDYFLGGTQDNGTLLFQNGDPVALEIMDGDGVQTFFDQVDTRYLIGSMMHNDLIALYNYEKQEFALIANNENKDGFFINPQALDSNLDLLFSNGVNPEDENPDFVLYRYDNLLNLQPIEGEEIDDNDPVARRRSFRNPLLDAPITALNVSPHTTTSSTLILGLANSKLLKVTNAHQDPSAAVWSEITGPQFLGSISDVEFGKSNDEVYVTFYNYGVRSIWYSSNATSNNPTWVNKEGNLPDLPVLSILPNPYNKDEVIVGTELGVWETENFTSSQPVWTQFYNGMSDVKVTDLDLKKGNNVIYAASYGRGIFSGRFKTTEVIEKPVDEEVIAVYPTVSEDGEYSLISGKDVANVEVNVYDLQGQLVEMVKTSLTAFEPSPINLTAKASGIYLLRITGDGRTRVQKVIRN